MCFSDAGLYVWGSNAFGQLGMGKLGGYITRPMLCQVDFMFIILFYHVMFYNKHMVTACSCHVYTYLMNNLHIALDI